MVRTKRGTETTPLLQEKQPPSRNMATIDTFPPPQWMRARQSKTRPQLPQCIAHRGYKARYPENTMTAFRGAVEEAGAHAIETDTHLTSDGVVVLSHDADLKRCFGRPERVIDSTYSYISTLRTTASPHVPMPRLLDLLEYLNQPQHSDVWILLDIKLDNDASDLMQSIASTIDSVPALSRPWSDRIVLGIWASKFLPLCVKHLPTYPVAYIGLSTFYGRKFLPVPNVGFNVFQKALIGPIGARFIRDVQRLGRPLYLWTVNEENMMKWSIQKHVDGVITDDPKKFNEVCEEWKGTEEAVHPTLGQWLFAFWLYLILALFSVPLKHRMVGSIKGFLREDRTRIRLQSGSIRQNRALE